MAQETVDEAAFDMEMADYDFFLFTDAATGADCLLDRGGPGSYRVTSTRAVRCKPTGCAVPVAVCPDRPPRLTAAPRQLSLTGAAYLFFIDRGTGRGQRRLSPLPALRPDHTG
ncbi:MAG: sigma 54 modulation/S30EA ribosomal C-terminal domain-containing protein [Frankiaceae bacterium]